MSETNNNNDPKKQHQKPQQSQQQQKPQQKKPQQPNNSAQSAEYNKQEFEKQFEMQQHQQKLIRQQIQAESPLIGDVFPLTMLMDEFVHNQGFYCKIQHLVNYQVYGKYRKTRRDGSCFYRALLYCLFEKVINKKDEKLREHLIQRIKYSKQHLLTAKFQGVIFQDIIEAFLDRLQLNKLPKTTEQLLKIFRDPEQSNYLVLMLRFITSGQLRNNAIMYQTFIDNQIPIQMFCQLEVQPIDKQADQIQIMALLNYLNVAIKIVYLDANMNKQPYNVVLPESAKMEDVVAELLYRPGHYDILYK